MVVVVIFTLMASLGYAADATVTYPVKNEGHQGGDVTPTQAYQMVKEQANVFIVDVRSGRNMSWLAIRPLPGMCLSGSGQESIPAKDTGWH